MLDFKEKSMVDSQKEVDLSYDLFRVDAVTFDELQSRTIALRSRKYEKEKITSKSSQISSFGQLWIRDLSSLLNLGQAYHHLEEGDHLEDRRMFGSWNQANSIRLALILKSFRLKNKTQKQTLSKLTFF